MAHSCSSKRFVSNERSNLRSDPCWLSSMTSTPELLTAKWPRLLVNVACRPPKQGSGNRCLQGKRPFYNIVWCVIYRGWRKNGRLATVRYSEGSPLSPRTDHRPRHVRATGCRRASTQPINRSSTAFQVEPPHPNSLSHGEGGRIPVTPNASSAQSSRGVT